MTRQSSRSGVPLIPRVGRLSHQSTCLLQNIRKRVARMPGAREIVMECFEMSREKDNQVLPQCTPGRSDFTSDEHAHEGNTRETGVTHLVFGGTEGNTSNVRVTETGVAIDGEPGGGVGDSARRSHWATAETNLCSTKS